MSFESVSVSPLVEMTAPAGVGSPSRAYFSILPEGQWHHNTTSYAVVRLRSPLKPNDE